MPPWPAVPITPYNGEINYLYPIFFDMYRWKLYIHFHHALQSPLWVLETQMVLFAQVLQEDLALQLVQCHPKIQIIESTHHTRRHIIGLLFLLVGQVVQVVQLVQQRRCHRFLPLDQVLLLVLRFPSYLVDLFFQIDQEDHDLPEVK